MSNTIDGRVGDVSGRLGDVSGRLGDVSGRLGDISGRASSADVQDCLLEDREADKVRFLEGRLARVESEVILVVKWVNAQLELIKDGVKTDDSADKIKAVSDQATRIHYRVEALETAVNSLRASAAPPSPTT
jgi:hypothetical protein